MNSGDIAWQVPLGVTDDLPEAKQHGRPNMEWVGSHSRRPGVYRRHRRQPLSRLRIENRREIWVTKIDAGAHTAPMTYLGKNGKQYVVVPAAPAAGFLNDRSNADTIIAFALP